MRPHLYCATRGGRRALIRVVTPVKGRTAGIAGSQLLSITVAATSAHFCVLGELFVPGDAATTAGNIVVSKPLFRVGIGVVRLTPDWSVSLMIEAN